MYNLLHYLFIHEYGGLCNVGPIIPHMKCKMTWTHTCVYTH